MSVYLACSKGKVHGTLGKLFPTAAPRLIRQLFRASPEFITDPHPQSTFFMKYIRLFNNDLSMASSSSFVPPPPGISFLSMKGALYHYLAPGNPAPGEQQTFAQMYLIDSEYEQLQAHINHLARFNVVLDATQQELLQALLTVLQHNNRLIIDYKRVNQAAKEEGVADFEIVFKVDGSVDKRRFNAPRSNELGGFMPGGEGSNPGHLHRHAIRNTSVRGRGRAADVDGQLEATAFQGQSVAVPAAVAEGASTSENRVIINSVHPLYDALHFVLLHPRGESGWNPSNPAFKGVTCMSYYSYFMHDRVPEAGDNSLFVHGGRLFEEWLVTGWARVEQQRLGWIKLNQASLRASNYQKVREALDRGAVDGSGVGVPAILPSTFVGGRKIYDAKLSRCDGSGATFWEAQFVHHDDVQS